MKKIICTISVFLFCLVFSFSVSAEDGDIPELPDLPEVTELPDLPEVTDIPDDTTVSNDISLPSTGTSFEPPVIDKRKLLQYSKPIISAVIQYVALEFGIVLPDPVVDILTDLTVEYLSDPDNFNLRTFSDTLCHYIESETGIDIDDEEFYRLICHVFRTTDVSEAEEFDYGMMTFSLLSISISLSFVKLIGFY